MARVFDLDFENVRIVSRDFAGETYGPDQRQFKVVIEDPELIQNLINDGVKIWCPERQSPDDPVVGYMTVKVSYRFGSPKIALLTPEGNAHILMSAMSMNLTRHGSKTLSFIFMALHGKDRMDRKAFPCTLTLSLVI